MARLLVALVGLAALPVVLAAPVPTHLMAKDRPMTIPTRLGTTWVYQGPQGDEQTIVITKVKEVEDGAKLVTTERTKDDGTRYFESVIRIGADGLFGLIESGEEYDNPWCLLQLSYRQGQTWGVETSFGCRETRTMTAEAREKVRVPAGEFDAVRVLCDAKLRVVDGGPVCILEERRWYAPGVGLVREDRWPWESWELKSFTLGKD